MDMERDWGEVQRPEPIFECLETVKFNLIPNILLYRTDVISIENVSPFTFNCAEEQGR